MHPPSIANVCRTCSRPVVIQADWKNPPTKCHHCRIKELVNLPILLERFLAHEQKLAKGKQQPQDRTLWQNRAHLRELAKAALQHFDTRPILLAEHCAASYPLRTLVYQMHRDKRRTDAPKRSGGRTTTPRVFQIVQGGAIGLGKRK